jgi:hypothetical protein
LPIGDAPAMADALLRAIRLEPEDRCARVEQQRLHLENRYALPRVAQRYQQIYERLAPGLLSPDSAKSP